MWRRIKWGAGRIRQKLWAKPLLYAGLAIDALIGAATATPRAFTLVVADNVSQAALSGFIGAFIFSIVALTAVNTRSYERIGLFVTFSLTVLIFGMVITVFLRWVDRIARLGRLGTTIDRVEAAAQTATLEVEPGGDPSIVADIADGWMTPGRTSRP